ncbi:MAG TPA: peptide chain release factor N(5)-glutamine methyltransferase [Syntrophales bacterium]|jgi:release factor glutamine methyltransferase|nr:peptide chain release factor N(5)-glutamine methyltransferase [Syntrophales bacterium]HON22368.1 peptide chain release factor N(5)-glutamine methyltransferase [Syntrophales bacterium]HOU77790.1 peptide chain release factor N(5)-glutamine methyltransferase [Syntrophales bacterium]HPC32977.1 peptide chain release factor N(5)-glutamine methyltransferase [Syntrophales bacterium]HQG34403.1 peptide chain release factor N(5)-glutamine methyltransferase [Syntrophales bacterium]
MTVRESLTKAAAVLAAAGVETARLDAEVLLGHVLAMERTRLLLYPDRELTIPETQRYARLLARRRDREPVAYIVGEKEFWSLALHVNPSVLIPRPDTEILVEEVLSILPPPGATATPPRLLEIGVGSGAVSIALAVTRGDIRVTATDVSPAAVTVARENAVRNGVAARIDFAVCSLFSGLEGVFDVIVSNPPYITDDEFADLPPEVRCYEPFQALRGGPDGASCHREIVAGAERRLRSGGFLVLEIGAGQRCLVEELLQTAEAYDNVSVRSDYAGCDRVIRARRR